MYSTVRKGRAEAGPRLGRGWAVAGVGVGVRVRSGPQPAQATTGSGGLISHRGSVSMASELLPAGCVSDLAVQCWGPGCEPPYGECRASRRSRRLSRRSSITSRRRSTFPRVAWFTASSEVWAGDDRVSVASPEMVVLLLPLPLLLLLLLEVLDELGSRTKLLCCRPW